VSLSLPVKGRGGGGVCPVVDTNENRHHAEPSMPVVVQ
jgi:hypothetical protein